MAFPDCTILSVTSSFSSSPLLLLYRLRQQLLPPPRSPYWSKMCHSLQNQPWLWDRMILQRVADLILPKTILYSQRLHISKHLLLYGHKCRDQCLSHEHAAYYFTHADGQHEIYQPPCQMICISQNKWHYYCIADDRWNRA